MTPSPSPSYGWSSHSPPWGPSMPYDGVSSYGPHPYPSAMAPPVPSPVPSRPRLSGALGYAYSPQSVLRVTD